MQRSAPRAAIPVPTKQTARAELERLMPTVRLPGRKKGLAVPIPALLEAGLGDAARFELNSAASLLRRVLGCDWQRRAG